MHAEDFFDESGEERGGESFVGQLFEAARTVAVVFELLGVEGGSGRWVDDAGLAAISSSTPPRSPPLSNRVQRKDSLQLGLLPQPQDAPSARSGRGMLTGHEEGNHNVRDLLIGERLSILVLVVLQSGEHVEVGLFRSAQGGRVSSALLFTSFLPSRLSSPHKHEERWREQNSQPRDSSSSPPGWKCRNPTSSSERHRDGGRKVEGGWGRRSSGFRVVEIGCQWLDVQT